MPSERKYPLDTKRQVKAAIGLFGMHFRKYRPAKRRSAARRIVTEAGRRGIALGSETAVARYARRSK